MIYGFNIGVLKKTRQRRGRNLLRNPPLLVLSSLAASFSGGKSRLKEAFPSQFSGSIVIFSPFASS